MQWQQLHLLSRVSTVGIKTSLLLCSVLGHLENESKTASCLGLGLWPVLKFGICIAHIVKLAKH